MKHLGHGAPGLHAPGIVRVRGKPGLDVGAALGRQLAVDIGVQLVFGNGNIMVVHIDRLWLCGPKCLSQFNCAASGSMQAKRPARCINTAITSPA
ncbi:hypothetical protein ACQ5SK_32635 [Bradyrhizobium japonicum]